MKNESFRDRGEVDKRKGKSDSLNLFVCFCFFSRFRKGKKR